MVAFFWGAFLGSTLTTLIALFVGISVDESSPKAQISASLTAAFMIMALSFFIALGLTFYQGDGAIRVIAPTPTPLLGR